MARSQSMGNVRDLDMEHGIGEWWTRGFAGRKMEPAGYRQMAKTRSRELEAGYTGPKILNTAERMLDDAYMRRVGKNPMPIVASMKQLTPGRSIS